MGRFLVAVLAAWITTAGSAASAPSLCDVGQVVPTYFYFQPLDEFDMVIVTPTCSSLWNGNCTASRVAGYSLWKVRGDQNSHSDSQSRSMRSTERSGGKQRLKFLV
jgi:hypothetical protein